MIALPAKKVVKSYRFMRSDSSGLAAKLLTSLAIRGFELVQKGVALARDPPFWRLPIEIGAGAVVKRSVQVNPHLRVRVTLVLHRLIRSLRQSQANQKLVEC